MSTTFSVGDMTIHRIIESEAPLFDPLTFFPTLGKELLEENLSWLRPTYIDPASGQLMLCIQSYVVRTKHHTILIDSCVGNHKERANYPFWHQMTSDRYERNLAAAGVTMADIDYVMCTHMHVDHVGWNTKLENGKWVPTFPNAKYVMSRTDHDHWEALAKKPDTEVYQVNTYNDSVLPIVEARKAEFVSGDHAMCGCLTLKPAPGHTPGQIRVDLDSRGKRAIFAGDALHNPVQVPLWKWNSCFCEDRDLARQSRHTLLADCVEQGALLMPAHFAPPHAAYVKDKGDGFELDWDWDNARGR
jgi:glyoxylase-like metal-dependent hydrolase (beta-lactamase superfamily II)